MKTKLLLIIATLAINFSFAQNSYTNGSLYSIAENCGVGIMIKNSEPRKIKKIEISIADTDNSSASFRVTVLSANEVKPNYSYSTIGNEGLQIDTVIDCRAKGKGVYAIELAQPLSVLKNVIVVVSSNDLRSIAVKKVEKPVFDSQGNLTKFESKEQKFIGPSLSPINRAANVFFALLSDQKVSYSDVRGASFKTIPYIKCLY